MPGIADSVRVFLHPVLEEGNLSFPNGDYTPEIQIGTDGSSAVVRHIVRQAPFVERLVARKQAVCCCAISIPITGYRRLFWTDGFEQKIKLDEAQLGEPPILRPLILCRQAVRHTLSREDGVHQMWVNKEIHLEKGTKLAIGPAYRMMSSLQSLLSIENDNSLQPGQIHVSGCSEDGFYFKVRMASDLYGFIQKPEGEARYFHRCSILTHACSSCFALLAKDYEDNGEGEDGWRSYANLRALAAEMENKGLNIWNTEDFSPEKAATAMWPHRIPSKEENV